MKELYGYLSFFEQAKTNDEILVVESHPFYTTYTGAQGDRFTVLNCRKENYSLSKNRKKYNFPRSVGGNRISFGLVSGTTQCHCVAVPVTWADTDSYDATADASYTFTATFGTLPAGVTNPNTVAAPTVQIVVAP